MNVNMEQESGELLLCCVCGELFNGTAVLIIDINSECVDEVYCTPCHIQTLASKVKEQ